jgi:hypothetical protein
MRYRVTGFVRSGSNLFSRVVEAIGPDHAKIVALIELRKSFADAPWRIRLNGSKLRLID